MSETKHPVKLKFKITFEGEYHARPSDYETDDPIEMAQIDEKQIEEDPIKFLNIGENNLNSYHIKAQVTHVLEVTKEQAYNEGFEAGKSLTINFTQNPYKDQKKAIRFAWEQGWNDGVDKGIEERRSTSEK